MQTLKIQTQLLKLADKDKQNTVNYNVDENRVYISFDGHVIYVIPQRLWMLDTEKIFKDQTVNHMEKLCDDSGAKPAYKTGKMRQLKKCTAVQIGQYWVDEKLLKLFDKGATFKTYPVGYCVFVYEWDKLVGVIASLKYKENEKDA